MVFFLMMMQNVCSWVAFENSLGYYVKSEPRKDFTLVVT